MGKVNSPLAKKLAHRLLVEFGIEINDPVMFALQRSDFSNMADFESCPSPYIFRSNDSMRGLTFYSTKPMSKILKAKYLILSKHRTDISMMDIYGYDSHEHFLKEMGKFIKGSGSSFIYPNIK